MSEAPLGSPRKPVSRRPVRRSACPVLQPAATQSSTYKSAGRYVGRAGRTLSHSVGPIEQDVSCILAKCHVNQALTVTVLLCSLQIVLQSC